VLDERSWWLLRRRELLLTPPGGSSLAALRLLVAPSSSGLVVGIDGATRVGQTLVMIVVSGWLVVEPEAREAYLAGCRDVIVQARAAAGCIDFHLSADPIETGRINIYEQWETVDDVERFRGDGTPDDQAAAILDAHIVQHTIASGERLA
jgi:quinol monooxygenase YgiN